ncbi:hypothetical protein ACQ1QY_10590, partial [Ornithobacterium rhinotracheale]
GKVGDSPQFQAGLGAVLKATKRLRFDLNLFVVLNIIYKFVAMINTNNKFWWWCSSDPSVL